MSVEEITPEDSAAPVFLDPTPLPLPPAELPDNRLDELEAAAAELVALGMSEARARMVVGLPPDPLLPPAE